MQDSLALPAWTSATNTDPSGMGNKYRLKLTHLLSRAGEEQVSEDEVFVQGRQGDKVKFRYSFSTLKFSLLRQGRGWRDASVVESVYYCFCRGPEFDPLSPCEVTYNHL